MTDPANAAASGDSDPAERQRVVDLVAECLIAMEDAGSGRAEQRAVLERFCREHPGDAAVLRKRIGLLRGVGALESPALLDDDEPTTAGPAAHPPEHLGDFRLVRVLAQGGMGVIYLAVQESLGREVALKLVRPDHLYFPASRERFRREVEAVARMQHPSIVPVFTVGETQGIPWFAMELVRGASAGDALAALRGRDPTELLGKDLAAAVSAAAKARGAAETRHDLAPLYSGSWIDCCLRIVREMLAGLDHAHRRGVLHRDLKPSNLMLTPEGRVLLVDFGLAASTSRPSKVTVSGAIVGSLPYMAPEQLDPTRVVDERTDVYGAGVTLHELVTLANPFLGGDDDGPTATQRRILNGERTPLRARNPQASRDLEVVTAKAMAVDPSERYVSIAAFLRDVDRLLDGRPVEARPIALPTRIWRHARRRPAVTTAVALGFALVVAVPLALFVKERETTRRVTAALDIANSERGRAERNLMASLATVSEMIDSVGTDKILRAPELTPLRQQLIERALKLYREFLADNADNELLARALADTRRNAARLLLSVGRLDEAILEFESCQRDFAALLSQQPEDRAVLNGIVTAYQDQVATLIRRGRYADAITVAQRALALVNDPARTPEQATDPNVVYICSRIENNLALAFVSANQLDAAESAAVSALGRLAALAQSNHEASSILRAQIETRANLEYVRMRRGVAMSTADREETARLARDYAALDAADISRKQLLATCLVNAASSHTSGGERPIALLREAISVQSEVLARSTDPILTRFERCAARLSLRWFLTEATQVTEAKALALEVVTELEEIAPQRPLPDYIADALARTAMWWADSAHDDERERLPYTERVAALIDLAARSASGSAMLAEANDSAAAAVINALVMRSDYPAALEKLDRLAARVNTPAKWHFPVARTYALLAAALPADDTAARQDCRRKSLASLAKAIAESGTQRAEIEGEPKFATLRDDPEFQSIAATAP